MVEVTIRAGTLTGCFLCKKDCGVNGFHSFPLIAMKLSIMINGSQSARTIMCT